MKEVVGKSNRLQSILPRNLVIGKVKVIDPKEIENKFNAFFKYFGPSWSAIFIFQAHWDDSKDL